MTFQSISIQHLSKKFGRKKVLDDVNVSINAGEICAIVGKNGAGKTTLFKLLTEQLFPTSGAISFEGAFERPNIGSLIEQPTFFPRFSAYHNLAHFSLQFTGKINKEDILETLELVGLEHTRRKFETFSLGMKQRLGIALAILFKPDLLILDEPSNGLDPQGIRDVRKLLQRINAEQRTTILISSHVLTELEEIATDYIILDKGHIIEKTNKQALSNQLTRTLVLTVDDAHKTANQLTAHYPNVPVNIIDPSTIHVTSPDIQSHEINQHLVSRGVAVHALTVHHDTLEDYFFEKVGE